jgi:hypothetical protein
MKKLHDTIGHPAVIMIVGFTMVLLASAQACTAPKPVENHGWKEIDPPRGDLQCWRRWNQDQSTVCASSLTATHGASK